MARSRNIESLNLLSTPDLKGIIERRLGDAWTKKERQKLVQLILMYVIALPHYFEIYPYLQLISTCGIRAQILGGRSFGHGYGDTFWENQRAHIYFKQTLILWERTMVNECS